MGREVRRTERRHEPAISANFSRSAFIEYERRMRPRMVSLALVLLASCGGNVTPAPAPVAASPSVIPDASVAAPEPIVDAGVDVQVAVADASDGAATARTSACAEGEVEIPPTGAAGFTMMKGREEAHNVVITHAFCMDASEVTVKAFAECVAKGACREPWKTDPFSMYPNFPDHPVNSVDWQKSREYCAWAGKRLPTEAEWEWAATGPEHYKYPWGNAPEPSCDQVDFTKYGAPKTRAGGDVGCHGGGPSKVGSHPQGDRVWPSGHIHDLAGNVWEWVEDSYAPFKKGGAEDPLVRNETPMHPLRGGAWNRSFGGMVITYRAAAQFTYQVPGVGFRCVRGEAHPTPPPRHDVKVPGWKPPKKK